uniref:Chitin-binding type-2 domain-containing protein n=1 Tax=Steinernema glaseri TaxID=37863 RepID=A0A1I7YF45_9BILA
MRFRCDTVFTFSRGPRTGCRRSPRQRNRVSVCLEEYAINRCTSSHLDFCDEVYALTCLTDDVEGNQCPMSDNRNFVSRLCN